MREVGDRFRQAAFDDSWESALAGLADACGGRAAQLIGIGPEAAVPFNRAHNIDPEALAEFVAIGGGDPGRNARVRAGLRAPLLEVLTEADFGDLDAVLGSDLYADLFRRHDIPFSLQTTLMRSDAGVIGLAVLHSADHGLADEEERRTFAAIAPDVQAAARLQLALEGRGARILAGSLEALGVAAFICDAAGRVHTMTEEAERLALAQAQLTLVGGGLRATHPQDAQILAGALRRAGERRPTGPCDIALRAPQDGALLRCQVVGLPTRDFPFGYEASTLVVARPPRDPGRLAPLLRQTYGLTLAEAGVALGVARGRSIADIALERGISDWTVRSQLKAVAAKLGVTRQAQIAARLADL